MFVVGDRVTHLKTKAVMFVEGVSRAGEFYKCRYRHNNTWSYDTFPEEELALEYREPVIALACLNQHPEHQWEDSGLCLGRNGRQEKGMCGVTKHGFEPGPAVEVCSRPGCGLIRVKQQREVRLGTKLQADDSSYREAIEKARESISKIEWKEEGMVSPKAVEKVLKSDLGWDNAFGKIEDEEMTEPGEASFSGEFCSRDGYERGICSCGQPWRVKFTERTVFYCVECGGALVAGPEPNLPNDYKSHKKIVHATWVSRNVARPLCEAQLRPCDELERQDKSKVTCKVCNRMLAETASSSPDFSLPQPGDPYSEKNTMESVSGQVRCERCQCLTPVSELSRDAQGRMVCKHHG